MKRYLTLFAEPFHELDRATWLDEGRTGVAFIAVIALLNAVLVTLS